MSLEPCSSFDVLRDPNAEIPVHIHQKTMHQKEQAKGNTVFLDALGKMQAAAKKPAEKRGLPFSVTQDCDFFKIVPKSEWSMRTHSESLAPMASIGSRVSVYWEGDKQYYSGYVSDIRNDFYFISYDDGQNEWLPLAEHQFRILAEEQSPLDALKNKAVQKPTTPSTASRYLTDAARFGNDGCRQPRKAPQRLSNGLFQRPKGRAPTGYSWDTRRGVWQPPPPSQTMASMSMVHTTPIKARKAPQRLSNGLFQRPKGRAPTGYSWDTRRGVWQPPPPSQTMASMSMVHTTPMKGKRKDGGDDDSFEETKRPKGAKSNHMEFADNGEDSDSSDDGDNEDSSYSSGSENPNWWEKKVNKPRPKAARLKFGRRSSKPGQATEPKVSLETVAVHTAHSDGKRKGDNDFSEQSKRTKVAQSNHWDFSGDEGGSVSSFSSSSAKKLPPDATPAKIGQRTRTLEKITTLNMPVESVAVASEMPADHEKVRDMQTSIGQKVMDNLSTMLALESLDTDATERCRKSLESLNTFDITLSCVKKELVESLRNLQKHPTLGDLSKTLIEKWQKSCIAELVGQWKESVAICDVETAIEIIKMVKKLYCRIEKEKNTVDLSKDFIAKQELRDRVQETLHLFNDKNVSCEELDFLEALVDDVAPGASELV